MFRTDCMSSTHRTGYPQIMYAMGGLPMDKKQLYSLLICERDQALQDSSRAMSNGDKIRSTRDLIKQTYYPDRPRIVPTMTSAEVAALPVWEVKTDHLSSEDFIKNGIMTKLGMAKWTSCYAVLKMVLSSNQEWWLLLKLIYGIDSGTIQADSVTKSTPLYKCRNLTKLD